MYKNYHHQFPIQIRFCDLDAFNHVNNANYLSYIELGRIDYITAVSKMEMSMGNEGIILAKATIDFRLPIYMTDEVVVFTRCSRIGNKSFDLEYEVAKKTADGYTTAATSSTVIVALDYTTRKTIPVPDSWKENMIAFEGEGNIVMS